MIRKVMLDGKVVTVDAVPLIEIESSTIAAIGYSAEKERLFVRFKSTPLEVWAYHRVPLEVWAAMQEAESKGKYFYARIKSRFTAEKIIEEQEPKPCST